MIINQTPGTVTATARPENDDNALAYFFFGFVVGLFLDIFGFLFLLCECNGIVGKRKPAFIWGLVTSILLGVLAIVLIFYV